jgi:hypothetical protein
VQQAERCEAGYDVCSELASHDACVSMLSDHLTEGMINVLVFKELWPHNLTLRITIVLPLHINSGLGVIKVSSFNL